MPHLLERFRYVLPRDTACIGAQGAHVQPPFLWRPGRGFCIMGFLRDRHGHRGKRRGRRRLLR